MPAQEILISLQYKYIYIVLSIKKKKVHSAKNSVGTRISCNQSSIVVSFKPFYSTTVFEVSTQYTSPFH